MLFDTDILIWCLRGNQRAARLIDTTAQRTLSLVSYMELLQGARNKKEIKSVKGFLSNLGLDILPLSESIGQRAAMYLEEHRPSEGLCMADALIAASAVEYGRPLATGNTKHFKGIPELETTAFRP